MNDEANKARHHNLNDEAQNLTHVRLENIWNKFQSFKPGNYISNFDFT